MAEAAYPGGRAGRAVTVEQYNPAGPLTEETPLGCPNCSDPYHLIMTETALLEVPVDLFRPAPGVTDPEVGRDPDTERIVSTVDRRQVTGIRCETCNWAVTAGDALRRVLNGQRS